MTAPTLFHPGNRALQDEFASRALADRLGQDVLLDDPLVVGDEDVVGDRGQRGDAVVPVVRRRRKRSQRGRFQLVDAVLRVVRRDRE